MEALLAVGFVEKESLENEEAALFYVLEEPSLEDDFDAWGAWYERIKAQRDALAERMGAAGVRTLPAATRGIGWSEKTNAPPTPQQVGGMTLHGLSGGM